MSKPKSSQAFELEVTLLEDLHTGSGMGSAVVDRLLARAGDGTPVIAREHLKGVWRDNALRLCHLGRADATEITALFGSATGTRGCLIAPELRPDGTRPADSLFWDATARKARDRAPDDHSLRRTEYLPAGLVLRGRGTLDSGDPKLRDLFERIVRYTNALGSERTRGSGLIRAKLTWVPNNRAPSRGVFTPPKPPEPDLRAGVRLLLRAEAPLCIPTTGAPGNIIPSEHHIPGRTLFGALAAWLIAQGTKPDVLFDRRLSVGPAYPLPRDRVCSDSEALAGLTVIPIPLHLWSPKPEVRPQTIWPHWAGKPTGADQGDRKAVLCDMLSRKADEANDEAWRPDKTSYKRPKDNAYLIRQGSAPWTYFESPLGLRMRNRRGDPIAQVAEDQTALFTVEQMPSGSRFIADIQPLDPTDTQSVADLLTQLSPLLDAVSQVAPMRIGRGGAPVVIDGWCPIPNQSANPPPDKPSQGLTITLLSDLIARTPNLSFHTELTVAAVKDCLLPDVAKDIPCDAASSARGYSDNLRYQGFNAVAGLPAAPRIAIRRGSVLCVQGPCAAGLVHALKGRTPIGDQTWEGNGRFALDLDGLHDIRRTPEQTALPGDPSNAQRARRDRVIAAAEALCAAPEVVARLPGRSQLGNLRDALSRAPHQLTPAELDALLRTYRKEAESRRGKAAWSYAFEQLHLDATIKAACCDEQSCHTEDVELFLRVLTLNRRQGEMERD